MAELDRLTPKQEQFVEDYLDSDYIEQAARSAGISERTARRWLKLPEVLSAIDEERARRRERLRNRLDTCLDNALRIAADVLFYGANPDEMEKEERYFFPERIDRYVALMLKFAQDRQELDALRSRVAQLEASAKEKEKAPVEAIVDGDITPLSLAIAPGKAAKNGQIRSKSATD